jgi:hypothetical protein
MGWLPGKAEADQGGEMKIAAAECTGHYWRLR